jgi:uncharacterized protein YbjQ (UPF0145 family)
MSFEERSDALVELLDELSDQAQPFVLVGGYAVSPYIARFSTDLDLVVASDERGALARLLEANGFERTDAHEKNWSYATEVIEYEKRLAPNRPIGCDLLVNGLGCRQTHAQWSFDYLYDHSTKLTVRGQRISATARVVDGPVLVAAKLHSARATDLRDVVAIATEIDLDSVTPHLRRGDEEALREQLERGREILDGDEFEHGFQSDFGTTEVQADTVERLWSYLGKRIAELP